MKKWKTTAVIALVAPLMLALSVGCGRIRVQPASTVVNDDDRGELIDEGAEVPFDDGNTSSRWASDPYSKITVNHYEQHYPGYIGYGRCGKAGWIGVFEAGSAVKWASVSSAPSSITYKYVRNGCYSSTMRTTEKMTWYEGLVIRNYNGPGYDYQQESGVFRVKRP